LPISGGDTDKNNRNAAHHALTSPINLSDKRPADHIEKTLLALKREGIDIHAPDVSGRTPKELFYDQLKDTIAATKSGNGVTYSAEGITNDMVAEFLAKPENKKFKNAAEAIYKVIDLDPAPEIAKKIKITVGMSESEPKSTSFAEVAANLKSSMQEGTVHVNQLQAPDSSRGIV
jgi:hypothetical protein